MIRISRIFILFGQVIFLWIGIIISQNIICPFKLIFSIPCPFCGLTRSFYSILAGNIKNAMYYNILILIVIILLFFINIVLLIEIIKNEDIFTNKTISFITQNKKIIIFICLIMLIFSMFINIYHRI